MYIQRGTWAKRHVLFCKPGKCAVQFMHRMFCHISYHGHGIMYAKAMRHAKMEVDEMAACRQFRQITF